LAMIALCRGRSHVPRPDRSGTSQRWAGGIITVRGEQRDHTGAHRPVDGCDGCSGPTGVIGHRHRTGGQSWDGQYPDGLG
jgi:hypothetical protein